MRTYDVGPKPLPLSRNKKIITTAVDADISFSDIAKWITYQKAKASSDAMAKLADKGRWPQKGEDVRAYIGNTDSNRFKNVGGFFAYMTKNYHLYEKRWRFEPTAVMDPVKLKEAGDYAFYQCRSNQTKTGHLRTGLMFQGFMYLVKEKEGDKPYPLHSFESVELTRSTEIWIANPVEYASSVEAHSVQRARTGGIMYQAAKQVKRKYKGLKVQYTYTSLEKLGLPMVHKYAVPIIRIGFRGNKLKGKISVPGRNIKRRRSAYRRMGPHTEKFREYRARMNATRRKVGYRRIDDRHFGDDLFSYYSNRRRKQKK